MADVDIAEGHALSLRALVSGIAIGAVLAMADVFMSLKTGWSDSGNLTGCIAGFALMSLWSRRRAVTAAEINTVQSVATMAAAVGFTSGIGGAVAALALLGHPCSPWAIAAWAAGLGSCGIALAFARRERLFALALPFPTSVAAAQLVDTFRHAVRSGLARARTLALAVGAAGVVTWFRDGRPAWIPSLLPCPGSIAGASAAALTVGVGINPMLLGGGALLGVQIGASVLAGSVLAYVVAAPLLVQRHIVAGADYSSLMSWLLWPGVGLLLSSTVTSFAVDVLAVLRRRGGGVVVGRAGGARWLAMGLAGAAVVVAVARVAFGLGTFVALIAIVVTVPIAEAAMRAYGETDLAPVGSGGQLVQIGAASAGARGPLQDLPLGAITAGITSHATASILALKIGERLGATARRQLPAQIVGTAVGIAAAIPAYVLVSKAYRLGGESLPAPGVMPWKAVAEAAAHGTAIMPPHAAVAGVAAFVVGALLTLLARVRRLQPMLPSPTAMGMGMLVPQFYSSTIFLGALAGAVLRRRAPAWAARDLEATASGLIVGESATGVVIAALIVCGVLG